MIKSESACLSLWRVRRSCWRRKKPRLYPAAAPQSIHVEHRKPSRTQAAKIWAIICDEDRARIGEFHRPQLEHIQPIIFACAVLGRSVAVIPFLGTCY